MHTWAFNFLEVEGGPSLQGFRSLFKNLDDVHPWSAESYYVGHRLVGIDTRTKAMMRKVLGILKDHCYIDNIKEGWHLVIKS